ncbi:protein-disulfide isomerase [Salinibacterium sp. UTAS2018]|uniref:DsbA family protein n=1 Tax=Salinibacterium sp. UTAS2018 TaxID=2508880 RepID=UPI0010096C4D|nr:thioredoxin domain-containing protein [Salinibacterium sp. UTAS2018]QAV69899.1 protein-disulfide isomerase [Salinibacterium sp. UTAS2018]
MKKALLPTFAALGILALVAAFVFVYVTAKNADSDTASSTNSSGSQELASTVASDSNYVDNVGPDAVTIVEFLDFECGACGQFYPYVEAMREVYDGDINYVVRYFPLPSHLNSMDAAVAAEAAAQQGEFEAMYQRLFETQADWAGGTPPQTDAFRALAEDIGLDMAAYDDAVADPATQERVEADFDAGVELGVTSTPTFFVNDEYIETSRLENLPEAVDAAVKG